MKHIFNISKTSALACALSAACLTSVSAQSVTPDAGKIIIKAEVVKSTCAIMFGTSAQDTAATPYKVLNLGNNSATSTTAAAGGAIGTPKSIWVLLRDPSNPAAACTFGLSTTGWKVTTKIDSTSLVSIAGGRTFLKNTLTTGGTDAAVALSGKPSSTATSDEYSFIGGTEKEMYSSGQGTKGWELTAQFVQSGSTTATAGKFNFNLPLTVSYY